MKNSHCECSSKEQENHADNNFVLMKGTLNMSIFDGTFYDSHEVATGDVVRDLNLYIKKHPDTPLNDGFPYDDHNRLAGDDIRDADMLIWKERTYQLTKDRNKNKRK